MRTEFISCDTCEEERPMREAGHYLRVTVQTEGRKFYLDLCGRACASDWFRSGPKGQSYQEEEEPE